MAKITRSGDAFLSIQAQDFIEDSAAREEIEGAQDIPEHSSSGLH